jgi:hypothetical protein
MTRSLTRLSRRQFARIIALSGGVTLLGTAAWSSACAAQYITIVTGGTSGVTLPLFDVAHTHPVTRLVLTGPRASFSRTSSG